MKATKTIPAEILDNQGDDAFKNDFFNRFTLGTAPEPLKLNEDITKNYSFPTFYSNVTCAISIFMCSYKRAAELVAHKLHPKIKPVGMTRGRSLIAFSCYEYKNVMGVPPYNEIAMAIPIMVNSKFSLPLLPMIMSSFSRFGYYIAGMPVTSFENQVRGNKIWGLPKVTQDIDIEKDGTMCVTTAYEETGEEYLKIYTPTDGKPEEFDETSNLYSRLNGKLLQSETNFKTTFNVTKNMDLLFRKNVKPERTFIEIGNSKSAEFLSDLQIEEKPFQCRYAEGMSSCFNIPNKDVEEWFKEIG